MRRWDVVHARTGNYDVPLAHCGCDRPAADISDRGDRQDRLVSYSLALIPVEFCRCGAIACWHNPPVAILVTSPILRSALSSKSSTILILAIASKFLQDAIAFQFSGSIFSVRRAG